MALRIDTQGRIEAVRFQNQTGSPAAPAAGYSLLYLTANGLYMETSDGAVIGPFVTGTAPAGGRTLIQELLPTGTTASFTSIPGTYKKLTIEFAIRSTQAATAVDGHMRFNGDTTAGNYRYMSDRVNAAGQSVQTGNTYIYARDSVPGSSGPASEFCQGKIEITQYANTAFRKMALVHFGHHYDDAAGFLQNATVSFNWMNTAAITQIDLLLSAGNYAANSVLRLYGEP